jgi:hypothetical protein
VIHGKGGLEERVTHRVIVLRDPDGMVLVFFPWPDRDFR